MLNILLPLVAMATSRGGVIPMRVTSPHQAQHLLADVLASADSIDYVRSGDHRITFAIDRAGEAYTLVVRTNARDRVVGFELTDAGPGSYELGDLSWLVDVMKQSAAVTRLGIAADGTVTVVTADGERYQALPGRGSNAAVEARWAAAWNA